MGPPSDVCRQLGVSEATLYIRKKKSSPGRREFRELRSLEDENARLKRLVADLSLENHPHRGPAKSEAHTAPRAGRRGPDDLRCQLRAGLSSGAVQSSGVCAISRIRAQDQRTGAVAGAGARGRVSE